jgi:hypothetical protein
MVRGIEGTAIFRDDRDRTDFVARLARLAEARAWTVYAWALLRNHAHLLVRTGRRPLARTMRSILTGYAGAFDRRHKRMGHLFQNRYKSIGVEGYRRAVAAAAPAPSRMALKVLVTRVCRHVGVPPPALAGGGRIPALTRARAGIAYLWVEVLGRPGRTLTHALGVHPSAIPKAARQGALAAAAWRRLLQKPEET